MFWWQVEHSEQALKQSCSCLLLRELTTPLFTHFAPATPSDLEFHKCGPAFAHAVPCSWNAYSASPPLCSADSLDTLRHRLSSLEKFPCHSLFIPTSKTSWLPQHGVIALYIFHLSAYLSAFAIGPSGFQTWLQKSHETPNLRLIGPQKWGQGVYICIKLDSEA